MSEYLPIFRCLKITLGLLLFVHLLSQPIYANELHITKTQLQELDKKIANLNKKLGKTVDKKALINQELAQTERAIGNNIKALRLAQKNLEENQHKINQKNQKISQLENQLSSEQKNLAHHVRVRHRVGQHQPLKWLLNQEDPYEISQVIAYFKILIQSQEKSIQHIRDIDSQLKKNREVLKQTLVKQHLLQKKLSDQKEKLKKDKTYQIQLSKHLNQEISSKKNTLKEYQTNRDNLLQLLKSLQKKNIVKAKVPFSRMRHKLPRPVHSEKSKWKKSKQGLLILAQEGLPVDAVYPGKVVFSNWLRGYGLLIILDHGRGYMTLYAHNQALFKHEGDFANQGEEIASIGHSGGLKKNGLYFEIRHRGKAVSPLDWLS